MSDIAIKVENISKLYQLGEVGTGTMSKDLNRWWAKLRGMEDPYAKVGQVNDRTKKRNSDFVWALNDINFEVKKGEVIGIVGKNGAGKSTLLKILSKITTPTKGKIYTKGRIASLLEVGTGFHPEMTGRENIYLNGSILGMRKFEIDKKFEEIVNFAGVEAYIDTPVKRYSSGMYVRLAFAVAAFLEPEILIIDEVLAVGDAEFQKKCLGRMKDVSINEGRTVLFVSHNMAAVKGLCNNGLLIDNGTIGFTGNAENVIAQYYQLNRARYNLEGGNIVKKSEYNLGFGKFLSILSYDEQKNLSNSFAFLEKINFEIKFESLKYLENVILSFIINDDFGNSILMITTDYYYTPISIYEGESVFNIELEDTLMPGNYFVSLGISYFISGSSIDWNQDVLSFTINKSTSDGKFDYPWATVHGRIKPKSKIKIKA